MVDILFGKETSQFKNHYESSIAHDYSFWIHNTMDVEFEGSTAERRTNNKGFSI